MSVFFASDLNVKKSDDKNSENYHAVRVKVDDLSKFGLNINNL